MNRGIFSSLIENQNYKDSDKRISVELQTYHRFWYDLLVNPNSISKDIDTRQQIYDYMKEQKQKVESHLEKRFIYFICSRVKVRFNLKRKPFYNPFNNNLTIHLLIGKKEEKHIIKHKFYDVHLQDFSKPKIDLTDKFITLTDSNGNLTTLSIHDLLESSRYSFGISSKVEYVGSTKNPHIRPINGSHTGLSDALYKLSNEDFDFMIYFNIFNVITETSNSKSIFNFVFANSMTDEISVEKEGKLIENSFIFYYDAESQNRNRKREKTELLEVLKKLELENNVKAIKFYYETEELNDYTLFSSTAVKSNYSHKFSVTIKDGDINIIRE